MPAQVGDELPDVRLFEGTPDGEVSLQELGAGKKILIVGFPGPFTPVCSRNQLPGYLNAVDEIKSAGIDEIVFVAVTDAYVMDAWGQAHGTEGKVRMLADTHLALTQALDVEIDMTARFGNIRCKRFALLAQDNIITAFEVEPDGIGLTISLKENFLKNV